MEQAVERPVPLHRETHPFLDVQGCFGCKIANVKIGGVHRFKREREEGYTQADVKRDIYFEARRTGRDIKRAGSVSPTSGGLLT